ncbi:MAG: sigma 54-interacting transcriptional regulator [Chitinispirillaceae bacterium]|nr:sigma 54-interacting transcriptional regulator [Chitinispirillaceae bacterium]
MKSRSSENLLCEPETEQSEERKREASTGELRRVRKELEKSGERYRAIFEYTGTAVIVIDEDMTITMANHKLEEFTGYAQEEILKKHKWTEFVVPEDRERMTEYHLQRRIDPQSVPSEYEFRLTHRDGTIRDMLLNVAMIPGSKKSLVSLVDVTRLKRSERALRQSERRYRELFENANDIVFTTDLDGNFTSANLSALTTFGYTVGDIARTNIMQLIDPSYQGLVMEKLADKRSLASSSDRYEVLARTRGGKAVWVELSTRLIREADRPVGIQGIARDITERKSHEEQLRESEARFRSVYDCSPIGIALYNRDGNLIDHNGSFARMFGEVQSPLFPGQLFGAAGIDPCLREQLLQGGSISAETVRSNDSKKAPTQRWFEWHLSAIGLPGAGPSMYLAQVQEVTARKEADEARLQKERDATARAEALVAGLRRELREYTGFHNIVSRSPGMKRIFDILPEVAQATAAVLISGESGTGKELVARSLHELSARKKHPFIPINCSALPDTLFESELFGYKAGAFTDAKKDKCGRFALAEGGTVFLDEIGDISPAMQVKLLRVLQEKAYEPLGATQPVKANVRVIAATNKNLGEMVGIGTFREDLYYRINVVTVHLPPLRERRCDIPLLCNHFIERFNARYDKKIKGISEAALQLLMAHDFPGNIRELENSIEHAFIFCKCDLIESTHLPASFRERNGTSGVAITGEISSFDELERMYIKSVLIECGGNKITAADRMGIHKATLFRKLKQFGIK